MADRSLPPAATKDPPRNLDELSFPEKLQYLRERHLGALSEPELALQIALVRGGLASREREYRRSIEKNAAEGLSGMYRIVLREESMEEDKLILAALERGKYFTLDRSVRVPAGNLVEGCFSMNSACLGERRVRLVIPVEVSPGTRLTALRQEIEALEAELQRQRVVDWNSRPFAERAQAWREHLEAVQRVNEARRRSSSELRKALDLYRHEILDNLQIDPDTLRAR